MYNLAVVGHKDAVLGFKALGVTVATVETASQAKEKLLEFSKKKEYLILFITEDLGLELEEELKAIRKEAFPVIIPIPGNRGSFGVAERILKSIVTKAMGKEISV